jgi:hypothetical protein
MTGRRIGGARLAGFRVHSSYFARRKPRTLCCPATLRLSFCAAASREALRDTRPG